MHSTFTSAASISHPPHVCVLVCMTSACCSYLSMFCRWRDRARRSCAQHRDGIPGGRKANSGLPSACRWDPERSSGSCPPRPLCTHHNWGRTSRTSSSLRFHSDCRRESYDRLGPIKWDEIRALFGLKGNSSPRPLSHTQPEQLRHDTD